MEAYRERVAPLIEVGCNCHGPASDRPWRFDHRSEESLTRSLSDLRNWMYNPALEPLREPSSGADAEPPIERYALNGYASAQCGFNHPLIWEAGSPQNTELARWFERAYREIERPPPLAEAPATTLPDGALPARESAVYAAAIEATEAVIPGSPGRDGYDPRAGYGAEGGQLAAMVAGQCGCCHVPQRGFVIPPMDPEAGRAAHAHETLCSSADWLPFSLTSYGLGTTGDPATQRTHPIVYRGPDDPRLRLLARWFTYVAEHRPQPGPGAPIDPCAPDAGVPVDGGVVPDGDVGVGADGGMPDPLQAALRSFRGPVGQMLEARCSAVGCHGPQSASFPYPYPFADDQAALAGLAALDELGFFDRGDPANSRLILIGTGQAPKRGPLPQRFSEADVALLVSWIRELPEVL